MPWLEATANGIKARVCLSLLSEVLLDLTRVVKAFASTALRTSSTFKRYSFSKKVFNIRAAAGIAYYMQDGPVADQFVQVSNCVKGVWTDWYNAYNADSTVDAPNKGNVNVNTVYTSYIRTKLQTFFTNLRSGVQQMIGFYSTAAGGDPNTKNVDLNYGTLQTNGNTPGSANDLKTSIFNPLNTQTLVRITLRL
jgi:hypothetical protein